MPSVLAYTACPWFPPSAPIVVPSPIEAPSSVPIGVPSIPSSVPIVVPSPIEAPSSVPIGVQSTPSSVPIVVPMPIEAPSIVPTGVPPVHVPAEAPTIVPSTVPLRVTSPVWIPLTVPTHVSDELDALVHQASQLYNSCNNWEELVPLLRGSRGDFNPQVAHVSHRAAHLINRLRLTGAPVTTSTPPWSPQRKLEALLRGPHQSALQNVPFLRKEYVDMIHKGQWMLLLASLVLDEPNLRLSPLGVVPQRDRRPQTISDYTYFWVNEDTVAVTPAECMQFGRAHWRILKHIKHSNPNMGPVYMSKIDIADGFYCIWVRAADVPKLGVLFPSRPGDVPLVGFPLALPMGWKESPKIVTAATETVADLVNNALQQKVLCGPHRLEPASEQAPTSTELPVYTSVSGSECPPSLPPSKSRHVHYHRPLGLWDVYVDDFLVLVQGSHRRRRQVKLALLHALDSVLRPVDDADFPHRQEPASLKKWANETRRGRR
jgi:hypothetical protein